MNFSCWVFAMLAIAMELAGFNGLVIIIWPLKVIGERSGKFMSIGVLSRLAVAIRSAIFKTHMLLHFQLKLRS